jgi:hypothetical protein
MSMWLRHLLGCHILIVAKAYERQINHRRKCIRPSWPSEQSGFTFWM